MAGEQRQDTTFEFGGRTYELVYAAKRVDMLEAALGNRSVTEVFARRPSLSDMRAMAAYGLREAGSAAWVNPAQAMELCGRLIEERGVAELMELAAAAIMRDCGFLFR
nr:hypothetical protein [uncultured Olsenella sp.]